MKTVRWITLAALSTISGFAQYVYDYPNVLNPPSNSQWTLNGGATLYSGGLWGSGSAIFVPTLPSPSNGYEINATLATGAAITYFLRATADGSTGYQILIGAQQWQGQVYCNAQVFKYVNGAEQAWLAGGVYGCSNNAVVRAVMLQSNTILLYINGLLCINYTDSTSPISSGQPGLSSPTTTLSTASIGHQDTIPPIPVSQSSIHASAQPTQVDLQWAATTDDPVGIGLLDYVIYRNDVTGPLGTVPASTTTFSDYTSKPSTNYTYTIYVYDQHLNYSSTSFNVTTPAMSTFVPKIGVRPLGSYWGAAGEQIDMQSGNLNYTTPILKAMGRGGWGVNFQLSYNSQNWRQDSGGVWNMGQDTGYGYGWRLQAGSMTPVYSGQWTLDHYLFIDSTGVQHPFTVNNSNVWTSTDGIYLFYNANTNVLHFPDGSFWTFGSTSSGQEQDAGTMYPTLMEDSNGNQVFISYAPGIGQTLANTSSRISTIEDVRGVGRSDYTFTYNTDPIPHLTGITNTIGTAENYSFSYQENYNLTDPFASGAYGPITLLSSSTVTGIPLTTYFTYDTASATTSCTSGGTGTSGPAQLTQLTTPYCGYLRWTYHSKTLAGTARMEIFNRYVSLSSRATETSVQLTRANDSSDTVHLSATLIDTVANSQKVWNFQTDTTKFWVGLITQYSERTYTTGTILSQLNYSWSQTPTSLNPYISTTTTHLDPGQTYEADKKTTQTLDQYGNMTQMQVYNFGTGTNVGPLARTYSNTYLYQNNSNYVPLYIFNRLATSTVTDGTNTATLVSNTYDATMSNTNWTATCSGYPQLCEHDTANYPYTFNLRGDLSSSTTPTATSSYSYDMTGTVLGTLVNGVNTSVTATNNFAAPGQITTNTLTSTMNWTSFLGPSSASGPNGDTGSINYDSNARPYNTTSPYGAVTNYAYHDSATPPNKVATTNGHWSQTSMDGFGRTIQTNAGYGGTTTSTVDTQYAPCGCSPLGKMYRVSQPYGPGGTDVWTTYTYDASGRTVSVVQQDGSTTGSTTAYLYQGNTVKVTDPASRSKTFTMDAFGNLTNVQETDATLGTVNTSYTYDILNHLTGVSMPRGTTTQTRTFNYNSGTTVTGFLQSATNPENGTVSYTYNSVFNTLASKTDAKGQTLLYGYDGYNRLTTVTLSPSTVLRTYSYDTNPLDSTHQFSQYASGRLTAVQYRLQSGVAMNEQYSYTQAGMPATKRLQVSQAAYLPPLGNTNPVANLDTTLAYNNEGKITSMTYPSTGWSNGPTAGPTYNYSYDSMYRLNGMTTGSTTLVNNVTYNAANQMLMMSYANYAGETTESRSYNLLNQLVSLTVPINSNGIMYGYTYSYNYPTNGTNNGKISSMYDPISGETVQYIYDSLNRLSTATGASWGESYGFDGFGNLTSKTVTAGSGPSMSLSVNQANNQIQGVYGLSYDANGNASSTTNGGNTYGLFYDAENRVSSIYSGAQVLMQYAYDGQNRRMWIWSGSTDTYGNATNYTVNVYTPSGQKIGAYSLSPALTGGNGTYQAIMTVTQGPSDAYFGSKRLASIDRLRSAGTYFPWGEAKGSTNPQDAWGYATYWRDSVSGLDYAHNRYYSNAYGRFMTPDASGASAKATSPQSWNRYAYVLGDPVAFNDPTGTSHALPFQTPNPGTCGDIFDCPDGGGGCTVGGFASAESQGPDCGQGPSDNPCVGADGFTQSPSPYCQVGGPPPPAPTEPAEPTQPECFAQLKYRPIDNPIGKAAGGTHSFWWVQDSTGAQWIISGLNNTKTGTLDAAIVPGDANGEDNSAQATWFNSGLSSTLCDQVAAMLADARSYKNGTLEYHFYWGPNSNSFADAIGTVGGLVVGQFENVPS